MWITVKEFAQNNGISIQAVGDRINRGKLKCKMEGRRRYVEVHDEPDQQDAIAPATDKTYTKSALESRWDVENELKLQKIENIKAEIVLKKQHAKEYRERLRVEFCEGVLECFGDAFSGLKAVLVNCKLKREQIRKFKAAYSKCLKKFEVKLVKFLKTKDAEEEESKEVTK